LEFLSWHCAQLRGCFCRIPGVQIPIKEKFRKTIQIDSLIATGTAIQQAWTAMTATRPSPIKYKTAEQPMRDNTRELIALDTNVYFPNTEAQSRATLATKAGLKNMGYSENDALSWVKTDTFQLLNHQVSLSSQALACAACHGATTRMNLKGELGYSLKGSESVVFSQCHEREGNLGFKSVHEKHVKEKQYDCSKCHSFTRPERGLK
jgi:cytochrome c553